MKTTFLLCLVCLLLLTNLSTGCATRVSGGARIDKATLETLKPGLSYQEIIAELGPPYDYVDGRQVIAYRWTTNRGYRTTNWRGEELTVEENAPHAYALCLRFDSCQCLHSWVVLEATNAEILRPKMKLWAAMPNAVIASGQNRSSSPPETTR